MEPIAPLMIEHRLIERMIDLLVEGARRAREVERMDVELVRMATDFLRSYADRTHHGKEEDILFKELAKKELAPEHRTALSALLEDHSAARKTVRELMETGKSYAWGYATLASLLPPIRKVAELYPRHIQTEEKFFLSAMQYLSPAEQADIMEQFWRFDREVIHEKYRKAVEELEASREPVAAAPEAEVSVAALGVST